MTGAAGMLAAIDASWAPVAGVVLLGALLTLDDTAFAQTWLSRPLPAALLTGLILGDPLSGLALGLPLEIVLAGNLPVGQGFTGDTPPATVAVTAAALLDGRSLAPALEPGGGGLPLLGWLLLAVALLSAAGQYAVAAERRANTAWMLLGHRTLRDGNLDRIGQLHLRCLLVTAARGAATVALALVLVLNLWLPLLDRLPPRLETACGLLALLVPGLGLGSLIEQYGLRRAAPWLAGGAALGAVGAAVLA